MLDPTSSELLIEDSLVRQSEGPRETEWWHPTEHCSTVCELKQLKVKL